MYEPINVTIADMLLTVKVKQPPKIIATLPGFSPIGVTVDTKTSVNRWGDPNTKFQYIPDKLQVYDFFKLAVTLVPALQTLSTEESLNWDLSAVLVQESNALEIIQLQIERLLSETSQTAETVHSDYFKKAADLTSNEESQVLDLIKSLTLSAETGEELNLNAFKRLMDEPTTQDELRKQLQKALSESFGAYSELELSLHKFLSTSFTFDEFLYSTVDKILEGAVLVSTEELFSVLSKVLESSASPYDLLYRSVGKALSESFGNTESVRLLTEKLLINEAASYEILSRHFDKDIIESIVLREAFSLFGKASVIGELATCGDHLSMIIETILENEIADIQSIVAKTPNKVLSSSTSNSESFVVTFSNYFAYDYVSRAYTGTEIRRI